MTTNIVQLFGWERWDIVAVYCVIALVFLYGILRPRKHTEWRSAGMAAGWVIALYAEMYGLPLTLYLLAPVLGSHLAPTDFQRGHLWAPLFGLENSVFWAAAFVTLGQMLILTGALLSLIGWRQLWGHRKGLIHTGLYRYIRHPQYSGFFLFIIGSMINWPTIPTLAMAPLLMLRYQRLAVEEEKDMMAQFGEEYSHYMAATERFFPRLFGRRQHITIAPAEVPGVVDTENQSSDPNSGEHV